MTVGFILIVMTIGTGGGSTMSVGPLWSTIQQCEQASAAVGDLFEASRQTMAIDGIGSVFVTKKCVPIGNPNVSDDGGSDLQRALEGR